MFKNSGGKVKNGKLVSENLFFFSETGNLDCNQFIIRDQDTKELSLFDAGNGLTMNGLIEGMKRLNLQFDDITRIYITHEHVDHVPGLYHILLKMEDRKPQVFAFGETADILKNGIEEKNAKRVEEGKEPLETPAELRDKVMSAEQVAKHNKFIKDS